MFVADIKYSDCYCFESMLLIFEFLGWLLRKLVLDDKIEFSVNKELFVREFSLL